MKETIKKDTAVTNQIKILQRDFTKMQTDETAKSVPAGTGDLFSLIKSSFNEVPRSDVASKPNTSAFAMLASSVQQHQQSKSATNLETPPKPAVSRNVLLNSLQSPSVKKDKTPKATKDDFVQQQSVRMKSSRIAVII